MRFGYGFKSNVSRDTDNETGNGEHGTRYLLQMLPTGQRLFDLACFDPQICITSGVELCVSSATAWALDWREFANTEITPHAGRRVARIVRVGFPNRDISSPVPRHNPTISFNNIQPRTDTKFLEVFLEQ